MCFHLVQFLGLPPFTLLFSFFLFPGMSSSFGITVQEQTALQADSDGQFE